MAVTLSEQLVDTGAGANLTTGGQGRAGKEVAGLRTVNITLLGFLIVKAAHEQELFPEISQGREHTAELHRFTLAFGPPFPGMETIAGEDNAEAHGSFAGGSGFGSGRVTQTLNDSIHGSAMETPTPRRKARREN